MRSPRHRLWLCLLLPIIFFSSACAPKKITIGAAAALLEDVAKASYRQSDFRLIRQGMPSYLMLMDGMIEAWPENKRLALAAAQAYASYASVLGGDADKDYVKLLYSRAKTYALRSLELSGLEDPAGLPFEDFEKRVRSMGKKDLPCVFWAAVSWGSWIGVNMDSIEAMAELPRVDLLMRKVLELDEGYYYGGAHLFMGMQLASKPKVAGGSLEKAKAHFLRAIELGGGKYLMAYVYYADYYAKKAFDKTLYISILRKVLESPPDLVPELTLLNTAAQSKARDMISKADEYFE